MSDKKYPYICMVSGDDVAALMVSHNMGIIIDDPRGMLVERRKTEYNATYAENNDGTLREHVKNITSEYLDNTYGEVKDERHAGFIKALAEADGFLTNDEYQDDHDFFCITNRALIFIRNECVANSDGEKLITIPQPPEDWNMADYTKQDEGLRDELTSFIEGWLVCEKCEAEGLLSELLEKYDITKKEK